MQFFVKALVLTTSLSSLASACIYKRAAASWSYTGSTAAPLWAELDPTYGTCATGTHQSPINIQTASNAKGTVSFAKWPAMAHFEVENNGHTIELTPKTTILTTLGGTEYKLSQFHFHTPSEHRLNTEGWPLEVHFVHQHPTTGALAVFGVFFDVDAVDSVFTSMIGSLSSGLPAERSLLLTNITDNAKTAPIYTYSGSLTTPPCTEGVSWFVSGTPLHVSYAKYKEFKNVMKFNSRFTQNVGGNNILKDVCT